MVLQQQEPKKIYVWINQINNGGIYHNPSLGLISLSNDLTNWITISDKNLGATQVYNSGATLSESNCGKFYQWGNNYGFPFTGASSKSSSQVNAQNYGPGNYYSSSTFIYGNLDWSSVQNDNLWGGTTNTLAARQGPCASGYHVPSKNEFIQIKTIISSIGLDTTRETLGTYLKIPYCGFLSNGDYNQYGSFCWSCESQGSQFSYCLGVSGFNAENYQAKTGGYSIRPFKNDSVAPDNTRTVLYQSS